MEADDTRRVYRVSHVDNVVRRTYFGGPTTNYYDFAIKSPRQPLS
jgi:hypothetical protein